MNGYSLLTKSLAAGLLASAISACSTGGHINDRQHTVALTSVAQPQLIAMHGQLDLTLPEQDSKRSLVNSRRTFLAYQGQGELWFDFQTATAANLTINGKHLTVKPAAALGQQVRLDISQFTRNGLNQLAVTDVQPEGAQIRLIAPYPTLRRAGPATVGFSEKKLAELDQFIEREIAQGFPGAVLVIVKDGRIIKETAYGYANRYQSDGTPLQNPEPMTVDTIFDLASNSKMYATNYALMKLVSEGKLDVNLPVQHYIPEYQGEGREDRLVSDLLHHSAGYAPELHFFRPDNRAGAHFYSLERDKTTELLIQQVPFVSERGKTAVYSDNGYMMLGILIEKITGMPLDQYLEQHIYQPLGLTKTMFNPLSKGIAAEHIAATELDGNSRGGRVSFPANRQGVVRGEVHDEKAWYSLGGVAGHAGLFSTAAEVATLISLVNQGGYGSQQYFTPAAIQQFVRPSAIDHRFGLGWRTAVQGDLNWHFGPYASAYAYGHTGWTGTATLIDPYYDLSVVLLTNKKHSPILEEADGSYYFAGDRFETGMYGSIMSKIYEAMF